MKVFYKIEGNKPVLISLPPDKYVKFILDDGNLLPDKFYFKHVNNLKVVCLAERISDDKYKISWVNVEERETDSCEYSLTDVYEYIKEKCIWKIIS